MSRTVRVIENPQFTVEGGALLNNDKKALENYKKQKKLNKRLLEIEKRLEMIERVMLNGTSDNTQTV